MMIGWDPTQPSQPTRTRPGAKEGNASCAACGEKGSLAFGRVQGHNTTTRQKPNPRAQRVNHDRRVSTSMSGFTPRLAVRPRYPSLGEVTYKSVREYVRDMVLGTVAVMALAPMWTEWASRAVRRLGSERLAFTLGTALAHTGTLVATGLPFVACDRAGWLRRYKLPRKPSQTPSPSLMRALVFETVLSHLVSTPVATYVAYPLFAYLGMPSMLSSPEADVASLAKTFAIAHFFNDVMFYWTHRAFHVPCIYKRVHKQHHNFHATIAPAAEFAHFAESFISNIVPTIGGCLFFGRHPLVFWIWLAIRLQQTLEVHSGYSFAGTWLDAFLLTHADSACEHDHHHTHNSGCFGALWLDYLCGTMDTFLAAGGHVGYRLHKPPSS